MDHGPPCATYNYCVTAQPPSGVIYTCVGQFTNADETNLIIATTTQVQVHTLTAQGLEGVITFSIYGRIASLELLRPLGEKKDLLFISTERYRFCVLQYDNETGELVTRANGDIRDQVGRPVDLGQLVAVDPACRLIALHLYDCVLKVIPVDSKGALGEAVNMRWEELAVHDLVALHGQAVPTLAALHEDAQQQLRLSTYHVHLDRRELAPGPVLTVEPLERGARMLIPVPEPLGGVLVVGPTAINYYFSTAHESKSVALPNLDIRTHARVDASGERFLLGDTAGRLYLLLLEHDGHRVLRLRTHPLGKTTLASSLAYLDNGVVYVGSWGGDSQLVKLHSRPPDPQRPAVYLEELDSFPNLGPIVDLAVVDLHRQGQGQVVTCSGLGQDGSLRIIRNGIGISEQASLEVPGLKGVWSLKERWGAEHDTYLLLTFVGQTQVLSMKGGEGEGGEGEEEEEGGLGEVEVPGFDGDAQTLVAGNCAGGGLVQVTPDAVRLVDEATLQLASSWKPPAGQRITVAAMSPTQVVVAMGQGQLAYLEVEAGQLKEAGTMQLAAEVSCLDISPLEEGEVRAAVVAVGLWSVEAVQVAVPSMQVVSRVEIGGEVIPRSVLHCQLDGVPYLLLGLGDGQLHSWRIDPAAGLTDRRKITLGTQSIALRRFESAGQTAVFAACDRPTVVHSSNRKLLYSNVNVAEVTCMAPFSVEGAPDALALGREAGLMIGAIDDIQKLHIKTVPLLEQPRRITHHPPGKCYAVCTEAPAIVDGKPGKACSVKVVDEATFEVVAALPLRPHEVGSAIASAELGEGGLPVVLVGTAVEVEDEDEPRQGRLLVLHRDAAGLTVLAEREMKGAVYHVQGFQGHLLAACHTRVELLRWEQKAGGGAELLPICSQDGHTAALYVATRGDFIVVGDLMRSITLLRWVPAEERLELRARDFKIVYMMAAAVLDDDHYIGAEDAGNLFVCRKNSDSAADEERNRLEEVGRYHLGLCINRFRQGSLVMQLPDSEAAAIPTMLFGTVEGALGVIASLPKALHDRLSSLQSALRNHVKGVGGLDHETWRTYENQSGPKPCLNFVDGDLIEHFLELPVAKQAAVAAEAGEGVEEVVKLVEDLARLH